MESPGKKYSYNRRRVVPPHQENHGASEDGWLISYADMMTLLFGFFVILYSMSKVDKKKYDEMSQSMAKQFQEKAQVKPATAPPAPTAQFSKMLKEQLLKSGLGKDDVEIVDDGKTLTISMRGKASFESGKTKLLADGESLVRTVANDLKTSNLPYEVRVEGHTDDATIVSQIYPSNWELSAARAAGVTNEMAASGIPPERLVASGFGSSRPIKDNREEDGTPIGANMALNRRVMIVVAFPETPEAKKAAVVQGPLLKPLPRTPAMMSAPVRPSSSLPKH